MTLQVQSKDVFYGEPMHAIVSSLEQCTDRTHRKWGSGEEGGGSARLGLWIHTNLWAIALFYGPWSSAFNTTAVQN